MRLHRTVHRPALLALIVLAAAAGTARADDDDGTTWPRRASALYVGGGAQHVGNHGLGGPALFAEHALGRGRWQGVADATVQWFPGKDSGVGLHVDAGVRWLARSFDPDASAAIQMTMHVAAGVEHLELAGGRITRPELAFGWGWQVRALEGRRWTIRINFRFELAPAIADLDVDRIMCKGRCAGAPRSSPIDEGFKTMMGFAW